MNIRLLILAVFTILILASCGSKKKTASSRKSAKREQVSVAAKRAPRNSERDLKETEVSKIEKKGEPSKNSLESNEPLFANSTERYIYEYAEIAKQEMNLYGIPASITLAQGILESSAGQGDLTRRSNNHFGIKCNGWQGAKVYHDDDAYQECFRKYTNPKYSFRDHSLFLVDRRRYAGLFELDKDDYKGWAKGLRKAGYATDPRYPSKLIGIIERYGLHQYDNEVLGNSSRKGKSSENLQIDYTSIRYTVKKGDTLYKISQEYNLSVEELKRMNNLTNNNLAIGQKLYVKSL